jgi:cell division protein FtsZ
MAMMGIGMGSGDDRAVQAAKRAIESPLLEDIDVSGARGVLVNITGSSSLTMDEFEAVNRTIHEKVHEDANIIVGVAIDESMGDDVKVTAIVTGVGDRFDIVKDRRELRSVSAIGGRPEVSYETPAYVRAERQPAVPREPVYTRARSFADDEEDQYDIPTFLRKSVD